MPVESHLSSEVEFRLCPPSGYLILIFLVAMASVLQDRREQQPVPEGTLCWQSGAGTGLGVE